MKRIIMFVGLLCLILPICSENTEKEDWPVLRGPYLGQNPPGMNPEVFAAGVFYEDSATFVSGIAFTADARVCIFRRYYRNKKYGSQIFISEIKKGVWTRPVPAPFNSEYNDWDFNMAADGSSFYFTSNRPLKKEKEPLKRSKIWVTQLTAKGWSAARLLDYPLNTDDTFFGYPSITRQGTIYFHSRTEQALGKTALYRSKLNNGKFTKIEILSHLNLPEYREFDPVIAPDESYIIYYSDSPPAGLYIAFHRGDNTWTQPIKLLKQFGETGLPGLTPDGKYFFFKGDISGKTRTYWVDVKFIENLKSKDK